MSPLNNLPRLQHEDHLAAQADEDNWTLAGQSQASADQAHLADNPYPATVPSGDEIGDGQQSILTRSVLPPPASHPIADTFEVIGSLLEILGSIADLFQ